jgi:hypothetical protein
VFDFAITEWEDVLGLEAAGVEFIDENGGGPGSGSASRVGGGALARHEARWARSHVPYHADSIDGQIARAADGPAYPGPGLALGALLGALG